MNSAEAFEYLLVALARECGDEKDLPGCIQNVERMIERLMFARLWMRMNLKQNQPDFDFRTGMPPRAQ